MAAMHPAISEPSLASLLELQPYQAYSYSYPHKTAYRALAEAVPLRHAWADEDRRALFLYVHVPFCTYRCGFCNLFTLARPAEATVHRYVQQLLLQLEVTLAQLGEHRFARFAMGGGTPSFLSIGQLEQLFTGLTRHGVALAEMPACVEVSPETVDRDKMALFRDYGVDRISMGVQSFNDGEVRALVRPQQRQAVDQAISAVREAGFPVLNLDLIYGIAGQSVRSFISSIDSALAYAPEELYLYPLYVRPMTGLGRLAERPSSAKREFRLQPEPMQDRLSLYRAGRDHLLKAGYTQVSMRLFRAPEAPAADGPLYSCQDDGMVGIGCGARSYTRKLHYATEFGVSRRSVVDILEHYLALAPADFAEVNHGFELNLDEQQRRFAIQSLLTRPGLSVSSWQARFGATPFAALPMLRELLSYGLAEFDGDLLQLTEAGFERADTIGPWLISSRVAALMHDYLVR